MVIDAGLYTHHKPVSIEGFLMYIITYSALFFHLNIDLYLQCIDSHIAHPSRTVSQHQSLVFYFRFSLLVVSALLLD